MGKILYEFQVIQDAMSSIESRLSDITSIISNVSGFSCEVPEITGDLEAAKRKTNKLLEDLELKLSDRVKKTNSLCSDYLNFESKMTSHSIFGMNLIADVTTPPVLGDSLTSDNIISKNSISYDIKLGDTLGKIAKEYNVTVDSIVKANKEIIENPNLIYVGDTLDIPVATAVAGSVGTVVNNISKEDNSKDKKTEDKKIKDKTNSKDNKGKLVEKNVINVPDSLGNIHTYMGWQMVTSPSSNQYKFRNDVGMNFDSEGFAVVDDRYVVACTTTYGNVGDYVDFVQEDGSVINAVIGDIKSQGDPGCTIWGHNNGDCIVEFVVDKNSWYTNNRGSHVNPGNADFHPEWNQNIVKAINYGSYYDYN